jgi:hypothetical protein
LQRSRLAMRSRLVCAPRFARCVRPSHFADATACDGFGRDALIQIAFGRASVTPMERRSDAENALRDAKHVLIVCMLDRFANGVRGVEIKRFLRQRGYDVRLVDTYRLSRASSNEGSLASKLPGLGVRRLALYAIEGALRLLTRRWEFGRRHASYYLLLAECRLRRSLLASLLPLDEFDLVICETPHDAWLLSTPTSARTLYDCPTPWADEIHFEGRMTTRQHARLRRHEAALFEGVDYLAFHWESYARYAVERYGITGRNLITLNWGCTPAAERASFSSPPRIAYLGSLSSRFINLPLLSRLSKLYPHIDVYGGPRPHSALGLNYMGFATPAVLGRYQFGLVTCTDDELRRNGFSAKHIEYFAHGLPVLVPAWRGHLELLEGSIPYEEHTFLSVIDALSDEREWRRMSDTAYAQAQRLTWNDTLQPLEVLLTGSPSSDGAGQRPPHARSLSNA